MLSLIDFGPILVRFGPIWVGFEPDLSWMWAGSGLRLGLRLTFWAREWDILDRWWLHFRFYRYTVWFPLKQRRHLILNRRASSSTFEISLDWTLCPYLPLWYQCSVTWVSRDHKNLYLYLLNSELIDLRVRMRKSKCSKWGSERGEKVGSSRKVDWINDWCINVFSHNSIRQRPMIIFTQSEPVFWFTNIFCYITG